MTRIDDRGSVLVDAMVALGVLAITLTLAAQAVQTGLRRSDRQEALRMAQLVARSRLAAVGSDIALTPGRTWGLDGPLTWSVSISPAGADGAFPVSAQVTDVRGAPLADVRTLKAGS